MSIFCINVNDLNLKREIIIISVLFAEMKVTSVTLLKT
jgi:hypothetical protein